MDAFDDDLLKALGELWHLRDQLHTGPDEHLSASRRASLSPASVEPAPALEEEEPAVATFPFASARHRTPQDLQRRGRRA
jgi:hypothetical protein